MARRADLSVWPPLVAAVASIPVTVFLVVGGPGLFDYHVRFIAILTALVGVFWHRRIAARLWGLPRQILWALVVPAHAIGTMVLFVLIGYVMFPEPGALLLWPAALGLCGSVALLRLRVRRLKPTGSSE